MKFIIFNAFRDKKKYLIFLSLFVFLISILLTLLINYKYYDYQIYEVVGKKERNRIIELNTKDISILKEINHIDYYYPLYSNQKLILEEQTYTINAYHNENIIYGRSINASNEIIISKLLPKSLNLKVTDLINKEINVKINNTDYKFLIVGVTDNNASQFYINDNELQVMYNLNSNRYYIVIDKYINVNKTINKLIDKGYNASLYDTTDLKEIEELNNIKRNYIYFGVLIILIITVFLINIIKNLIHTENKNLALLKILGFKSSKIKNIILIRLILIILLSHLLVLFIFILLLKITNPIYISIYNILMYTGIILLLHMVLIYITTFTLKSKTKKIIALNNLES